MKIVFISNYYTHHQQPLCEALDLLTDHQFTFLTTESFSEERKRLGWNMQEDVPFVKTYEDFLRRNSTGIMDADLVILGSAPTAIVQDRLKARKMVFFYAERVYKNGYQALKWLPRLYRFWARYGRHRSMYLLAASGYTAADYAIHGAFLGKSYQWGYFPETKHYDLHGVLACKNPKKILWCGRFLDWKHPEAALAVARQLKSDGYSFHMEIIGMGDMETALRDQVIREGLSECVQFLGAMAANQVRSHMEAAGIYLFTSDFHEGWGAVLNEAMNSGCAVVASHAIGSVPFLLEHGQNGLIYQNGDLDGLCRHVKSLLDDPQRQLQLGENAYETITGMWNAQEAASRLMKLAEEIQNKGYCDRYQSGPCSKAPVIRNHWFRG